MSRFLRPLLLAGVALVVLVPARVSEACWCSRVFTRSYCDPCVSCAPATRCCAPVAACPTTSCSTANVERCYYEPQTTYETRTLMTRQTSYVRRSYYDPWTCCNRSYLEPVSQWVERSYQVPVTSYVKRCSTEPVTTCMTSYAPAYGASYLVPETRFSHYWSPDGYRYYPVYTAVPSASCPVPNSNGSGSRDSSYGQPPDAKKSSDAVPETPKAPSPVPMPEKRESRKVTTPQRILSQMPGPRVPTQRFVSYSQ